MTPMYLDHFGLVGAPFSIAPDPRYLFMSARHREALAHLLYGVKSDDGFVVLTGEIGTGKTTVCRCLLEQLPADCEVAFVFNPKLSVLELLATVCEEFGIAVPDAGPGIKAYIDRINAWLLDIHARGRMAVLIIDEAQSLGAEVLEQVRLLTNLETNQRKLLRILLLGQPQLRDILARPDMAQLAQRIVARYHLLPLSRRDTASYVAHRLAVSGARRELFSPAALDRLYRLSGGVPRLVNIIADRALLGAYGRGRDRADGATVLRAGREALGSSAAAGRRRAAAALLGLMALGGTAALAAYRYYAAPPVLPSPVAASQKAEAVPLPVIPAALVAAPAAPRTAAPSPPPPDGAGPLPSPRQKADVLRQGSRGPAVERLRQDLAVVFGKHRTGTSEPVFNEQLAADIRRFQDAEGLSVDGMVGPQTRERLRRVLQEASGQGKDG